MGQQSRSDVEFDFRGVNTFGNPANRPRNSAVTCENFRVMPGNWLRMRGGRIGRHFIAANATVQQIHAFRESSLPGSTSHLAQVKYGSGSVRWHWFSSLDFAIDPLGGILNVPQGNDGGWTAENPGAVCNINDRPVLYNGMGYRDGSGSYPALASYSDGVLRYFGMDAYAPSGRPTVSFTPSAGGVNRIATGAIVFYVGLYNSKTGHYSNGVYAGRIAGPAAGADPLEGTITVSNLNTLLSVNYGSGTEISELKYVFYATVEGGQIPYLIFNATLDGPASTAVGSSSFSLALAAGSDNGFVLNLTHEVPTENFPPRRMRRVSMLNGRLYGSLIPTSGTGSMARAGDYERPFSYEASGREAAAIVHSFASGDLRVLGDPLQSWPPRFLYSTPNGQVPIWHGPSPDENSLLVITSTATFLLTEAADGLHEWSTVDPIHGIVNPMTVARTGAGYVWIDQLNQMVLLPVGSTRLQIVSLGFQNLLIGTPSCADHILDPLSQIDRYQVWFSSGNSCCYDFLTESAYTLTGQPFTAAATILDNAGRRHHVVANSGFYTHEAQAETGLIPTFDETFTGSGQAKTAAYYTARYRTNWDSLGEILTRKRVEFIDFLCDISAGAALTLKWWSNFKEPSVGNLERVDLVATPQGPASCRRAKLKVLEPVAWKLEIAMSTHAARSTFPHLHQDGELPTNFYGSILSMDTTIGPIANQR